MCCAIVNFHRRDVFAGHALLFFSVIMFSFTRQSMPCCLHLPDITAFPRAVPYIYVFSVPSFALAFFCDCGHCCAHAD